MSDIGVRELKIHASEIVQMVKEKGVRYVVTNRGRPVAAIVPIEDIQLDHDSGMQAWDELVLLGQQIAQDWQSEKTSTDILADMRR